MLHRPRIERVGYLIGALLLVSGLVHVAILAITGGSWVGPLSLRKPATFGLSFGLTLVTITWVSSYLRIGGRARAALLTVFIAACVVETTLISLQAWRGVPSHFNVETIGDAIVAQILAAGGVTLVVVVVVLTFMSFRAQPATAAGMRIAIRIGFVILVGAMATGGLMIAKGMRLVFAGNPQAAYLTGGSLKPTHAVTMHAILVLPLIAWVLSHTPLSERRQMWVVSVVAAGYALVAGVVAVANLTGALP